MTQNMTQNMTQLHDMLAERQNYLKQLKRSIEKELKNAPEGSLRISSGKKRTQYYLRKDPKDFNGVYLPKKELPLAQKIAQKDYNRQILRSIERELLAIEKYFNTCPTPKADQFYDTLPPARRKLVTPISEPEEEFVRRWETQPFSQKDFDEDTPAFFTEKGERVRSKSELIIANLLYREGIPYRYEYPIYLNGIGKIHPDFTVLHVRQRRVLYWEHLGMMDDSDYARKALKRISAYEQNQFFPGESLIITYETKQEPLNQKLLMQKIQHFLK